MSQRRITYRDIAKAANVSAMTVSLALRNHASIPKETRDKIHSIASRLGYAPDPFLSTLVAYRLGLKKVRFQSTIAFINAWSPPKRFRRYPSFMEMLDGARAEAERNGYKLEEIEVFQKGMTGEKMNIILQTRNIPGVIIGPLESSQGTVNLKWENISAVALGHTLVTPQLHVVANYQYHSMKLAMNRLAELGYQRIGLCIRDVDNLRTDENWIAGFLVEQSKLNLPDRLPPHLTEELNQKEFSQWFLKHKPDVVIATHSKIQDWIKELGMKIPQEVGYMELNCSKENKMSGIYQNSALVGATAVKVLIGMIYRNERGIPSSRQAILVEGEWKEGSTLR